MSPAEFRKTALSFPESAEASHMGHPDFRVQTRIFATIHPDPRHGMVQLTPEQQQRFVRDYPDVFLPENGAWGRGGSTRVMFAAADEEIVGEALTLAWQNAVRKNQAKRAPRPQGGGVRTSRKRS